MRNTGTLMALGGLLLLGCGQVLGLDEFTDATTNTGDGGASGASSATGSTTTSATTSTGIGGGGGSVCDAGTKEPCYSGPTGTEGVGACIGGLKTCNSEGDGFGPCEGEVLPSVDDCATPEDEDCTGAANEGCPCEPGAVIACYDGPPGTEGVGVCAAGQAVCEADGLGYGPCNGAMLPAAADDCEAKGDEDCDGYACSEPIWAQVFPGTVTSPQIAGTSIGNIYVFGLFGGTLTLGGATLTSIGNNDYFLTKLDSSGNPLWAKQFGDSGDQSGGALAVDQNENVIIALPLTGAFAVGGGLLTSAGSGDLAVAKFDANGAHLWSNRFGDASNQYPVGVAAAPNGDIVVTGGFAGTLSFGGAGNINAVGSDDIFLVKLSGSTGLASWAKRFGDSSVQVGRSVAVDSLGDIAIGGMLDGTVNFGAATLTGTSDLFMGRYDAAGNNICAQLVSVTGVAGVGSVAVAGPNDMVMAGNFQGTLTVGAFSLAGVAGQDIMVIRLDANCAPLWAKGFGAGGVDRGTSASVTSQGDIVVSYESSSATIDFGSGALSAFGSNDVGVATLDAMGTVRWARRFGTAASETGANAGAIGGATIAFATSSASGIDIGTGALPAGFPIALFAP